MGPSWTTWGRECRRSSSGALQHQISPRVHLQVDEYIEGTTNLFIRDVSRNVSDGCRTLCHRDRHAVLRWRLKASSTKLKCERVHRSIETKRFRVDGVYSRLRGEQQQQQQR